MKSKSNWKILDERVYETFPIFELKRSTRVNPRTNKPFTFFLMNGLDWVCIIALTPKSEIILVEQYRHGIEDYALELPGGCVEPGEDPAISAVRELKEETGYQADRVEFLGMLSPNPAMLSMRLHCYIARDVVKVGEQALDIGEDIKVCSVPVTEVSDLISSGKMTHALNIAAFTLLFSRKAGAITEVLS